MPWLKRLASVQPRDSLTCLRKDSTLAVVAFAKNAKAALINVSDVKDALLFRTCLVEAAAS